MKRIGFFILTASLISTFYFIADMNNCLKTYGPADKKVCSNQDQNPATVKDICQDLEGGEYHTFEDAKNSECM
ncbi:hypothetical protein A3F66_05120 [candidate division TM6 bacterium RIFCSPHIGHO2_12_FULL_32_22]|nr:MAG: hypothetical protein A3F66_05120 [candidate division TM6 bacterium RIFCSPHIGHO2_12_FULL_32_22]